MTIKIVKNQEYSVLNYETLEQYYHIDSNTPMKTILNNDCNNIPQIMTIETIFECKQIVLNGETISMSKEEFDNITIDGLINKCNELGIQPFVTRALK